ncbi:hypothetical protein D806_025120 [Mycolicibacterium smegmatis MKD8]|uniref:Uncharacterized protein n=1 Tax=Mycolicibacterium smegmatis (strain MKD8) TaxID=1214915 RepID=A0A2U9PP31_MYCSE|nr:hypothetical protein D806_025120 [Mycolicibacterium smegmatis MKD8]
MRLDTNVSASGAWCAGGRVVSLDFDGLHVNSIRKGLPGEGGQVPVDGAEIVLFPGRLPVPAPQLARVAAHARTLAAVAYEDISANGDNPVTAHAHWGVFQRFPVVTRTMTAVWRMMAARSFDDLADELEIGFVHPRTIGEHVTLSLIIGDAHGLLDAVAIQALRGSLIDTTLVRDLHDPASSVARRVADEPDIWFQPLIAGFERDPGRGFRRC